MLIRVLLFVIMSVTSAHSQTRQIVVQWAASASVGTSNFTGYKIYRCNPSPCTPTVQIGTSATNTYVDIGLANSTSYVYTWSAYGPGGETPSGQTSTATTYGAPTTRNVTCSGDITSALTTAISASADGDIVNIGAGSCSMGSITITDKNITVQGQGKASTIITAASGLGLWVTNGSNSPQWRLSNLTLSGPSASGVFVVTIYANQAAVWRGPYRIDHVKFDYPNNGNNVAINGPIWGIYDHDDFAGGTESALTFGLALSTEGGGSITTLNGNFGNTLPYVAGSANYTYIEDSTCTGSGTTGIAMVDTIFGSPPRHSTQYGERLRSLRALVKRWER